MTEKIKQQTVNCAMSCKTSELHDVMRFLSRAVPRNKKGLLHGCEITIKTNEVIFVSIGATKVLYCNSTGPVKVSIPFLYFYDIVKNIKSYNTQISIGEGLMTLGNLTVKVSTCFFNDDSILRSIDLPINYAIVDIIRLSDHYTPEEIEFNKLDVMIKRAYAEIEKDINLTYRKLMKYGVSIDDLRKIVHQRIHNNLNSTNYESQN